MIKGQVIAGDFSKVSMRVKQGQNIELGELLVIEKNSKKEKFILQCYDLAYASQISQQNLELVAGMQLEEQSNFELLDASLRNYQLAFLKPMLSIQKENNRAKSCKQLPPFFAQVRALQREDLNFITAPKHPFHLGNLRSGTKELHFPISLPGKDVFSHHVLIPASTGKGKSNLMSTILWDCLSKDFVGMLVLDPHDEYYGRNGLGLKDHSQANQKLVYYTPRSPPPGAKTLKFNLKTLRPEHFSGAMILSDPQRQSMHLYHKVYKTEWIQAILEESKIEGARFHEDTIAVVKRKLLALLNLELHNGILTTQGIFDQHAGENTIKEICNELQQGKTVIIDTSYFSGALEIMVGAMIATEAFNLHKYYLKNGMLQEKPVISIVLEEAPRVLGKKVLERGSNIFESIAREGRKFKIGLVAITQLPSEIPKNILANMNTKIILGIEMGTERQAVIDSSAQDLSKDNRNIASLDKGEALITSIFTRFAVPIKIPYFPNFVKEQKAKELETNNSPTQRKEELSFPGVGF